MKGILLDVARAARRRREPMGYWDWVARSLRSVRGVWTRNGLRVDDCCFGASSEVDGGGDGGGSEVVVVVRLRIGRMCILSCRVQRRHCVIGRLDAIVLM